MRRLPLLRPVFAVLLVALLAVPTAARARDAALSDHGAALPKGAVWEPLAMARVDALPAAPVDIGLDRITLGPGVGFPIEPGDPSIEPSDPSLAIVHVESGELTIRYAAAVEMLATPKVVAWDTFVVAAGDHIVGLPTSGGELRNDGSAPAVLLVFGVVPAGAGVAPLAAVAGEAAGDAEGSRAPDGLSHQPLAFGHAEALPAGPWSVAIARLTAEPGVVFPAEDATSGHPAGRALEAELAAVEAGRVVFDATDGPLLQVARGPANTDVPATPGPEPTAEEVEPAQAVTVGAGDGVFVPVDSVAGAEVVGAEPAVVLLAFVASASAPGLTGRR